MDLHRWTRAGQGSRGLRGGQLLRGVVGVSTLRAESTRENVSITMPASLLV